MNYWLFLLFCLSVHVGTFAEKILIITSAYNRADFIEIQHKTFRKFLRDEYEFVVFNDARDTQIQKEIEKTCSNLGVRCIRIPQNIHDQPYLKREPQDWFHAPAIRNANVVQFALDNVGYAHNGIVAIIDSDMFLVKPFSIKEFMSGYDLAGVPQFREKNGLAMTYLWIGISFLDMGKLPEKNSINFNPGTIDGVDLDAGGYTYYYLQQHPELMVKYFDPCHSYTLSCEDCRKISENHTCVHNRAVLERNGIDETLIHALHSGLDNIEVFINGTFFHYRSGTNWDRKSNKFHAQKTRLFNKYISKILD